MSDHIALCRQAAQALAALGDAPTAPTVVGFDGFVDHIIDVVQRRQSPTAYDSMPTIADLGAKISAAAGRSANIELVVRQSKIGGNGPIMANALARQAAPVRYVGNVGLRGGPVDEVFAPLEDVALEVVPLGPPAVTDALEFDDGKLMLGKLTPLEALSYASIIDAVGKERLAQWLAESAGLATVNWTMTLEMTEIWRAIQRDFLPLSGGHRLLWFVDLADPAKRSDADLQEALEVLQSLQGDVDIVLGLNGSEAVQVGQAVGVAWEGDPESTQSAEATAAALQQRLGLHTVMVHLVGSAAMADASGSASAAGFHCAKPMITTGAGDHFNAGFFAAQLAGLDPVARLLVGGATSGSYVRTGISPTRAAVIQFLQGWSDEG